MKMVCVHMQTIAHGQLHPCHACIILFKLASSYAVHTYMCIYVGTHIIPEEIEDW